MNNSVVVQAAKMVLNFLCYIISVYLSNLFFIIFPRSCCFKLQKSDPSEIASRRHRLHLPGAASGASAARPQGAAQEAQAAAGPRLQRAVGEGPVHGDLA